MPLVGVVFFDWSLFSRVVVLHLTIFGGGFLVAFLGAPLASLVLKSVLDLRAHLREHRKAQGEPA